LSDLAILILIVAAYEIWKGKAKSSAVTKPSAGISTGSASPVTTVSAPSGAGNMGPANSILPILGPTPIFTLPVSTLLGAGTSSNPVSSGEGYTARGGWSVEPYIYPTGTPYGNDE
jgi:hypothetical protein